MDNTIADKKPKGEVFFQFISRHKFLASLAICLLFSLIYLPLNGFSVYSGGDDPGIRKLLSNGEIGIAFVGYFFAWFSSILDPVFSTINLNIYFILHEIVCFFSLVIINYLFLSKLSIKKGLFFAALFDVIFFSLYIITIQFTGTSVVAGAAGVLCILNGCLFEKNARKKRVQIIGGGALVLLASEIRYSPFYALFAVTAALLLGMFLSDFIDNKKNGGFKEAFVKSFKKYIKTALALIIVAATVFGVNIISENLKYSDSNYKEFRDYNQTLAEVNDYRIANFFANKDFYRSIGIETFSETNNLKRWCVDDDFFTLEKLRKIADYSKTHAWDGAGSRSSFKVLAKLIGDWLSDSVKSGLIILIVFIIIAVLFALWILWMMARKKFYIVFPIILFSAIWGILIAATGGILGGADKCNILILPIALFTIFVSVLYNKNQQIIMFFLSVMVIALYVYLYLSRIHFYAALCFYLPAYAMMIFSLDNNNLKKFKLKKHPDLLKRVTASVLIITSVTTAVLVFTQYSYVEYPKDYDKVEAYIDSHKDNLFLQDGIYRNKENFNALVKPRIPENVISFGGWDKKSRTYKESLKSKGIKHLFRDVIDSNIIIIFFNYTENEDLLAQKVGDFSVHYNQHYAPKGKVIELKKVKDFNKYVMYKIVSKKAVKNNA